MDVNQPVNESFHLLCLYNLIERPHTIAKCLACIATFHNDELTIRLHVNTSEHLNKLVTAIENILQKGLSVPQLLTDKKYFYIHKIILFDARVLCCVLCLKKINVDSGAKDIYEKTAYDHRISEKHIENLINMLHGRFDRGLIDLCTNVLQQNITSGPSLPNSGNNVCSDNVSKEGNWNNYLPVTGTVGTIGTMVTNKLKPMQIDDGGEQNSFTLLSKPLVNVNNNGRSKLNQIRSETTNFKEDASFGELQNVNFEIMGVRKEDLSHNKKASGVALPNHEITTEQKYSLNEYKFSDKVEPVDLIRFESYEEKLSKFDIFFVKDIDFISTLNDDSKKTLSIEFASMLTDNQIFPKGNSEKLCSICQVNIPWFLLKDHLLQSEHRNKMNLLLNNNMPFQECNVNQIPTLAERFNIDLKAQNPRKLITENYLKSLHELLNVYWQDAIVKLKDELKVIERCSHELALYKYCYLSPITLYVTELKNKYSHWNQKRLLANKTHCNSYDDLYGNEQLIYFSENTLKNNSVDNSHINILPKPIEPVLYSQSKKETNKPILEESVANFFQGVRIDFRKKAPNLEKKVERS